MFRPRAFCLAFVLLAAVSPVTVPAAENTATETSGRDSDALPRGQPDTVQRGPENRAGSADDEIEPNDAAGVESPDTTGPVDPAIPKETEAADTEPLIPIETQNSIRVNANVSLPQDI